TGSGLLDGLDVQVDGDVLADQDAAGFQHGVPLEIEIFTVDPGGGLDGDALVAPGILAGTFDTGLERNLAGDAPDRQVADDLQFTAAQRAHLTAAVGEGRVIGRVEEIGRTQVIVPILHAGVDAGG